MVDVEAEDEKVMTESGTGRVYATLLAVNCTVAPLTVIVAPADGTPLTFITLLNQMYLPAAMLVPLKFELIVLIFDGGMGGAGVAGGTILGRLIVGAPEARNELCTPVDATVVNGHTSTSCALSTQKQSGDEAAPGVL